MINDLAYGEKRYIFVLTIYRGLPFVQLLETDGEWQDEPRIQSSPAASLRTFWH